MSRKVDPNSVTSKVSELNVGDAYAFSNPYNSVMVMVSNLKKKKGHTKKIFKVDVSNGKTIVNRVR